MSRTNFVAVLRLLVLVGLAIPAVAAREGTFHRTLEVNGAVDIDLTTGSGNVTVRTGRDGKVEVTGHIRASGWFEGGEDRVSRLEANPPIQQSGNSVRIGHIQDSDLRHNISISYELTVPDQTQLTAYSGSGGQDIDGLLGTVDVNSGSGDIRISNIGNTVKAETGSGNMLLQNVKGNVRAKTGSGTIRATNMGGGFEGETGSGHIDLQQSAPGAVRVNTGSGSVRLRLESDAAFDLNAHTSSGSISVNRPVTVQGVVNRREIRGRVRGGGPQVEVETSSGDIQIL